MHRPVRGIHGIAALVLASMSACDTPEGSALGESLAPNPGFEQGDKDAPGSWRFYSWQDAQGWWDGDIAHTGRHSVGMKGLNGGWFTDVPVQPGKPHRLGFYYRAEGGDCRLVIYVRVPGAGGKMETILYKPIVAVQADQRGQFVGGAYVGGADEAGWVWCAVGDFIPDEGTESVNLLIKINARQPGRTVCLDDISVVAREPRAIPDTSRPLRRLGNAVVWTDNVNKKILPEHNAPESDPVDGISIAAAGGEYEPFQIAISAKEVLAGVDWGWDEFTGPVDLDKRRLTCRLVETVNIDRTMGPYGHKGLNPDPLTDRVGGQVRAGETQSFWFTVYVPAGQSPGLYETRLRLLCGGVEQCRIPVRLRVRGFNIPPRPSFDVRSSFRWNIPLQVESGPDEEVLYRYYRDYYQHRTRCSPGLTVGVSIQGERAVVDLDEYVKHLRYMRDELGAKRFNIPSLFISHRGTHRMPPDASWHGRPVFAGAELARLDPRFEKPFRSYFGQLCARLREEGLLLAPTVRFFDEPDLRDRPTVNALRALAELIRDIEPSVTVAMTATTAHPALTDVIKLWVIHTDAWDREALALKAAQDAGCRIAVYNNAVNYPEHRRLRVRLWPWLLYKYRVDGTYSWWGTVCWRGEMANPWTAGKGNSGVMMYPPRADDEQGPIDSVRWELFREGLEDYEYMRLTADLVSRLEQVGKRDAAARGKQALEAAMALVDKWPNVRAANDEPYSLDVEAVEGAREKLAEAIETMQSVLP